MKAYNDTLGYLYNLEKFGIVFGLENITWILDLIDNPHKKLKTVHIGGTNGKGSVASILSYILKENGYCVGKYTSPHLVSFTERITVNEEEIKEEEIVELTAFIREKIERKDSKRFFTFFDFTTALALEYFYRKNIDVALIEVGLGGRLDSTNVIEPLASIITNVGIDHTEHLGNNIMDIAREKAGIIKNGTPVITGAEDIAGRVIEEFAEHHNSPVYKLGRDFSYEKKRDRVMTYRGLNKHLEDIFINLQGDHQFINTALALCATEVITPLGLHVSDESIYRGLSHIKWHGRLEAISEKPTIILDGAHNPGGIRVLSEFLKTHYTEKKKILIFGVMKDKEYKKMLEETIPLVDVTIITKPDMERALSPEVLKPLIQSSELNELNRAIVFYTQNVKDALEKARDIAGDNDLILITGSLYTIGEAKRIIHEIF